MDLSQLRIRSLSAWTIAIFGALALLFGIVGLIQPELMLRAMNFPLLDSRPEGDFTIVFLTASSMASLNMGVYYLMAALTGWKPFFSWTVPFRILTFTIFVLAIMRGLAPIGFIGVALWELIGALATGAALFYERQKA